MSVHGLGGESLLRPRRVRTQDRTEDLMEILGGILRTIEKLQEHQSDQTTMLVKAAVGDISTAVCNTVDMQLKSIESLSQSVQYLAERHLETMRQLVDVSQTNNVLLRSVEELQNIIAGEKGQV